MDTRKQQEWAQYILEQSENPTGLINEAALPVEKPSHNRQLRKKRPIDWSEQFVYIDSDCDSDYHPSKRSRCGTEGSRDRASPVRYIKREPGLGSSSERETYMKRSSSPSQYQSWDNDSTTVEKVDEAQEPGTTANERDLQSRPSTSTLAAEADSAKEQKRSRQREDPKSEHPLPKHAVERLDGTQDVHLELPAPSYEVPQPRASIRAPSMATEPAIRSHAIFAPGSHHPLSSSTNNDITSKDVDESFIELQPTTASKLLSLPDPEHCKGIKSQVKTPSSPSIPTAVLRVPMQIDDDARAKEALCPLLSAGSWMIVKSAMQQGVVNHDHWQPQSLETSQTLGVDKNDTTAKSILGKVFDIHEEMKTLSSDERLASWLKLTVDLVFTFPR